MSTASRREVLSASVGSNIRNDRRLRIKLDARTHQILIRDSRLLGPVNRPLAKRLVQELCARPGVRRAEVDVLANECRIDFDLGIGSRQRMADVFVDALSTSTLRESRWWKTSEPSWSSVVAYRHQGNVFLWQTFMEEPAAIRLVHWRPWGSIRSARDLADEVLSVDGVETCSIVFWSRRMTIELDRSRGPSAVPELMGRVEAMLEGRLRAEDVRSMFHSGVEPLVMATGWKRLVLLAVGGGALTMAVVAIALPGIRAAAFLVAGSYCLARSWPSLEGRLKRAPIFGPMLHQLRIQGVHWRPWPDSTVAGVSLVLVALILMPFGPVTFASIVLISSLGVFGIRRATAEPGNDDLILNPRTDIGPEGLRRFGCLAPPLGV